MTIVSSREFVSNEDKYFNLALDEKVFVKKGDYTYCLTYSPFEMLYPDQEIFEPDEDLRNSIAIDELRKSAHDHIHKLFSKK